MVCCALEASVGRETGLEASCANLVRQHFVVRVNLTINGNESWFGFHYKSRVVPKVLYA
jgi:hypothetical protein